MLARILLAVICLLPIMAQADEPEVAASTAFKPAPILYLADLYQPFCDPDDHWDIATAYALAKRGRLHLLGLVLDYPLEADNYGYVLSGAGDPALQAVAQLGYITGLAVPMAVGAKVPYIDFENGKVPLAGPDANGANLILAKLRESPEPVTIVVVGSCRNLAIAAWRDPEVFRVKCRAIYLNADTAKDHPNQPDYLEWNRGLDPEAYLRVWEIPCPIYWLPCFEDPSIFDYARYSSFWLLYQGDVLPYLSAPAQNYLLYALTRDTNQHWLSELQADVDEAALARHGAQYRNMWCTAGFLHMAGLTVSREGELLELAEASPEDLVYAFEPLAEAALEAKAEDRWSKAPLLGQQFIINVKDTQAYATAMPKAFRSLLEDL